MKRNLTRRVISLLLALTLLCGMIPTAHAAEYGVQAGEISSAAAPIVALTKDTSPN